MNKGPSFIFKMHSVRGENDSVVSSESRLTNWNVKKEFKGDIYTSCRKGDIERVKYLLETKDIDLNARDQWDSTPLYYACLCGHVEVCALLLANGAKCEENTFDGERCFYASLTQEIKYMLSKAKMSKTGKNLDEFGLFCEKLLNDDEYSDITFNLDDGTVLKLHRVILIARSKLFRELFETKWSEKDTITISSVNSETFRKLIHFIYTGTLTCPRDEYEKYLKLSKRFCLTEMTNGLIQANKDSELLEWTKGKRVNVSTLVVHNVQSRKELQKDFLKIIISQFTKEDEEEFLGFEFLHLGSEIDTLTEARAAASSNQNYFFDMAICVGNYKFLCHKVFLCLRSEYFAALINDRFDEFKVTDGIKECRMQQTPPAIIVALLYYVYCNELSFVADDVMLCLLELADYYLLPGLVKQCGLALCRLIENFGALNLLEVGRRYQLTKLENSCVEYIVLNIEEFAKNETLKQIIKEDSASVKNREEIDSIPIIDDMRYHLYRQIALLQNPFGKERDEIDKKLDTIEQLLRELNLSG